MAIEISHINMPIATWHISTASANFNAAFVKILNCIDHFFQRSYLKGQLG